jgi:hypothetical protein
MLWNITKDSIILSYVTIFLSISINWYGMLHFLFILMNVKALSMVKWWYSIAMSYFVEENESILMQEVINETKVCWDKSSASFMIHSFINDVCIWSMRVELILLRPEFTFLMDIIFVNRLKELKLFFLEIFYSYVNNKAFTIIMSCCQHNIYYTSCNQ